MAFINRGLTMEYKINNLLWHKCKLCNLTIKHLSKIYGGKNTYFGKVFEKHLKLDHNLEPEDYFEKYCVRPICLCGICNKKCKIQKKYKSAIEWRKWACGRNKGVMEWSKIAKTTRKGVGNPMYRKNPANKGRTKNDYEPMKKVSEKLKNKIVSEETKQKQSNAAKQRIVNGHTGHKHSSATIDILREKTIKRIQEGKFK